MRSRSFIKRGSTERGMAIDILALTIAIAGSLFFTSQLWSAYRQTLSVANLEIGLAALVPLRPQIYTFDAYGFQIPELDSIRIERLDSLVALLTGVAVSEVQAEVPSDAVFACVVHASSVTPPQNVPIALDFPYHSSNADAVNCAQLDLSALARAAPNSLHIIIASTTQSRPVMVLDHPLVGRPANRLYRLLHTATSAVQDMSQFDAVIVGGQQPM